MEKLFLKSLCLPGQSDENEFFKSQHQTCTNSDYPFLIFPNKEMPVIEFAPVTVFYGNNGSGKTTLLNIIAESLGLHRSTPFNGGVYFHDYTDMCRFEINGIPHGSQMLASDDVFDRILNLRRLNDDIDDRRTELFAEHRERRKTSSRLESLDDYEEYRENLEAKRKTRSQFVRERLRKNVVMFSNGESAMNYYTEQITENALYLIDEPENSLSVEKQEALAAFIADSARFFSCQFVIATHSPVILSVEGAKIYDLDSKPVAVRKWTELENVRRYFEFFESHRDEFQN